MRIRRAARWAVLVLAAAPFLLFGAYALTTRWLLSGPKLRALINGKPESFKIDWDEAWSPWPGKVRIHNLELRGSDPNVQWTVRLADAELHYSLLALATRTFRCTSLGGSGLAFALRTRLEPSEVKKADVSVLPPIPGFSDPPLRSPGATFQMEPHPWLVDVRQVALDHFDDIWVNGLHYRGPARVEGGFLLRPTHLAQIRPATVSFDGGSLQIGKANEVLTLKGTLATQSLPFEPIKNPMPEALRQFTTDLKVDVRADRFQAVSEFISFPEGVRLEGNGPTIGATLAMREGIATGRLTVAVRGGVAQTRTYRLRGNLDADVPFRRWNLLGPLSVDVTGTKVALTDVRASGPSEDRDWWGKFDVPSGKVGPAATATVTARCRDARPLLALLNVKLPGWTLGLLELDDFAASAAVSAAPGKIRIEDLEASGGNFKIQGQFTAQGKTGQGAFLIESGILIVGVEVTPAGTTIRPLFARQWYEKLQKTSAGAS